MKTFTLALILCLWLIPDVRGEDVTIVAHIHSLSEARQALDYPVVFEGKDLEKALKTMAPEDDVILRGRIEYHPVKTESRTELNPTFHVTELHPVSLKKIGKIQLVPVEQKINFKGTSSDFSRGFPVAGKVATAITLTASILLLKELSGNQESQPKTDTLNTGLIFSAGALATGIYLWETLKGPKSGN